MHRKVRRAKKYIYEHYGQGRDMILEQKALHESPVLLNYRYFLKTVHASFPCDYFDELRKIQDLSIRPELIRLLIEHHREKLRDAHFCREGYIWVEVAQFCARAKLESEFVEDLSAFCSTFAEKYALTRKMVSDPMSIDRAVRFFFGQGGAETWPSEAALVVSALEDYVNEKFEDLNLSRDVSLLEVYQANPTMPHAKSHIATIRHKIEDAPQIDCRNFQGNWMSVARFFEPEIAAQKNLKIR